MKNILSLVGLATLSGLFLAASVLTVAGIGTVALSLIMS